MIFCPMRILPCEPGMHACDQPLHAWFHVEQKEHEDRPPPSLFDFEGSDGTVVLFVFRAATSQFRALSKLHTVPLLRVCC
jgi:hypothetical protein